MQRLHRRVAAWAAAVALLAVCQSSPPQPAACGRSWAALCFRAYRLWRLWQWLIALARGGGCGVCSEQVQAAAANTCCRCSHNSPEESSVCESVSLLSVWLASILLSKHFPTLHPSSIVSILTPATDASLASILIDELAVLLFRDIYPQIINLGVCQPI